MTFYLFNFSVAPQFKKSMLSKKLMLNFIDDVNAQNAAGMACIAVSGEGVRIADRFGMSYSGDLTVDGSLESVFTKRF